MAATSKPITQTDQDVETIFDFLTDSGPFNGTAEELGSNLGLGYTRITAALGKIRRETEQNGWTIPFVRRGQWAKQVYAVVPTEGVKTDEEEHLLKDGVERQGATLIGMLDNVRQQAKLLKEMTIPRTAERKWANQLLSTTTYLVEQGGFLIEEQKERKEAEREAAKAARKAARAAANGS